MHNRRALNLWLIAVLLALLTPSLPRITAQTAGSSTNPALQPCVASAAGSPLPTMPSASLAGQPTEPAAAPVLSVVTTVAPLTNLAYNIGGSRIKVYGLIPEGADSHTFEPKPSAATALAEADLVIINGLHLEEPTRKLAAANLKPGAEIIELGPEAISDADQQFDFSFPKENGNPNPHLWMNPLLALHYAGTIRDALTKRDPAGTAYYAANYDALAARLTLLDQAICDSIASIPPKNRKLLTYHDSFAYFAPRYGMTVIGAIQPADFAEPSAQEVARLIDQILAADVPAIFGSEVFPSRVLNQIGKEAGVQYIETLADDDLPNQTGDRLYHSYLQLLVNDVTTMTTALGGDPAPLRDVPTANLHGPDNSVESAAQ